MTEAIWVAIITQMGLFATAGIGIWRKLGSVGQDAATAAQQTANDHSDAEYPNLRDEMTAIHETVRGVGETVRGHDRRFERLERQLIDVRHGADFTEETLDRDRMSSSRALARAIEERRADMTALERRFEQRIPDLMKQALTMHIRACPVRTPPTPPTP